MEIFSVCTDIIEKVSNNESDFKTILNKETKDLKADEKTKIASYCGAYFRNYFLISHLADFLSFKKDSPEFIYLGLLYINNGFLHFVDENKMFTDFMTLAISKKHNFSKEEIFFIKDVISKKRNYEFFNIKKGTLEYYSIKFNKPTWLIKLLLKQFGSKGGFKLLYELSKMPRQFARVSYGRKFNPNQNFIKIESDLFEYLNDTSIRKEECIYDKTLFITQACIGKILRKFNLKNKNITLFQGYENNLCLEVFKVFISSNNINFVSDDFEKVFKNFDILKEYDEKNAHFYEAKEDGLVPIINQTQDLIIYSPDSSNFELFRRNPEYGVYFKADKIDRYITLIRNGLKEISSFLDEDGKLLFMLPTLDLKETHQITEKFIDNNPGFSLIEEAFYLPHQEDNSLMYYAIIGKKHE